MDGQCHEALVKEMKKRAESVENNAGLMKACNLDLRNLLKQGVCKNKQHIWVPGQAKPRAPMLNCLIEERKQVQSPQCQNEILKVMRMQSNDVRAKAGME